MIINDRDNFIKDLPLTLLNYSFEIATYSAIFSHNMTIYSNSIGRRQ